jgi:hypothetical protein
MSAHQAQIQLKGIADLSPYYQLILQAREQERENCVEEFNDNIGAEPYDQSYKNKVV